MEIFGVGIPEVLLVLVIALIVFGPGKLPELGAALGRAAGNLRRATRDLTAELRVPIDEARSEIETTLNEAQEVVKGVGTDVEGAVREVESELQVTLDTAQPGSAGYSGSAEVTANAAPVATFDPADQAERNWLALGTWSESGGTER